MASPKQTLNNSLHHPINMQYIKKLVTVLLLVAASCSEGLQAQTSSFNFTAAAVSVSGWTNVSGDPAVAIRTATDAATGISISSVSTGNWAGLNNVAAYNGGGMTTGTFFPANVMRNHWFQYDASLASYNAALPQLIISGLNVDSFYTVSMTGSWGDQYYAMDPTRYTVAGATVYGYADVNLRYNTANGAVFHNVAPNSSGQIKIYVNTVSTTNVAGISGLQITRGYTAIPTPVVSLTSPSPNVTLPEDANITISADASETGGTITHVEFYRDTVKIGDDSTAPYSMVWVASNPGTYALKARAIDGSGNAATSTITAHVESLNDFWSTTGNIATNADTFFLGTVDSNGLAMRTKNIERMRITPTGNVGIGTKTPSAQLHTTGTVRLAGLTSDSTQDRVLVSDTSGKLYYRSGTNLSGRWKYAGGTGTVYDSTDNIGIGTSNTQGYKLAVNGTAIFTKVKVKTAGTWPDYVFEKGYALSGLAELEQYLIVHKHLPDIIPAAEAERDGIDVAAQQAALLKKVEELTLYLIEENKQLKEQMKQQSAQNARIDALEKLIRSKK